MLSLFYGEDKRVSGNMYLTYTLQPEGMSADVLILGGGLPPSMCHKQRPLSLSGGRGLGPSGVLGTEEWQTLGDVID